jgi:hypothetical protein
MRPTDLLKTVYLGDRACQAITLDGVNRRVVVQIDCISRVRSANGAWDYYTDEDIEGGRLVFASVLGLTLAPRGPIPNDYVNDLSVTEELDASGTTVYRFALSIDSVGYPGDPVEVIVGILARDFYLEDPRTPGLEIRE